MDNVLQDPRVAKAQAELASRILCRRRLLPFVQRMNPRYQAGWVHEDICARLEQFSDDVAAGKSPRLMLLMPPRHGKLLADSTPVRTTEGWMTHGELEPGYYVYGSSGAPVRVVATSPKAPARVRVELTTGEVFFCHENHEWTIYNARQYRWETRTAEWLAYHLHLTPADRSEAARKAKTGPAYAWRYRVPVNDLRHVEVTGGTPQSAANKYLRGPGIRSVTYIPEDQAEWGRCIEVAAEDGLYEVGENHVLTHNSELASRCFPAWHMGRHPDHEFIACSYNLSLAMSFSRKVKEIIETPDYEVVFNTRLHPKNQGAEEWSLATGQGGYVAAGVGGGITGKGAHVLVIDDPIKNAEEADSADLREKLWDWYGSTAYTRLAPGGGVLVIQTWWHDDDLAGRLQGQMALDEEADQFVVVKYPAVAESDEYLDVDTGLIVPQEPQNGRLLRLKGEALHPARYDLQKLTRIRKTIPARFWSALYQQNPVPDDGVYFVKENFRPGASALKQGKRAYMAWDFAISEKKHNDWTVGVVGLQDSNDDIHIVDLIRFKSADVTVMVDHIMQTARRWSMDVGGIQAGFEDGQIFRAVEPVLRREMKNRRMYFPTKTLKPFTDKMARARPLQGRMQNGSIRFDTSAPWFDTLRTEMLRFPAGAHDDQVDALAWLVQLVNDNAPPRPERERRKESWRDRLTVGYTTGVGHMAA